MWVEISYIIATGGSGSTRMELGKLPQWLADRPGFLIHRIREI